MQAKATMDAPCIMCGLIWMTGHYCWQAQVPVMDGDDADKLAKRVLTKEHIIYPLALDKIARGEISVEGETPIVDGKTGPILID